MAIKQKYAKLIKSDATMLLRPKTGLKDMIIEMDPGTPGTPAVKDGFTIPVSQTRPDVNLDEILSQPRPRHARLPAAAGGGRRRGPRRTTARDLSQRFRRFAPLNRDVAKLTGAARQAPREPRAA